MSILALGKHCSHALILVLSLAVFSTVAKRAEEEGKQFEEGGRRPGLTADIQCQVPAGEEGGPGVLSNILKEEQENGEELEGNMRDEEETQDDLAMEVVLMVNIPLVPFPLVSFPCSSCADDFPAKKK